MTFNLRYASYPLGEYEPKISFRSFKELKDWALGLKNEDYVKEYSLFKKPQIIIDFDNMDICVYDSWVE